MEYDVTNAFGTKIIGESSSGLYGNDKSSSPILQVFGLKTFIFVNSFTGILYFLHSSCVKSIRNDFKNYTQNH